MSSTIDLLNQTAARLRREGKTPSLALFKARLSSQLSGPALFAAYQQWRQQAPIVGEVAATPENIQQPSQSPQDNLQLQRIEAKLDKILALLEQQHVSG